MINKTANQNQINYKKICIIDYGVGNILSIKNAINFLGHEVLLTFNKKDINQSTHVILPGVGSFPSAMKKIKDLGLYEILKEISKKKIFILGICLGMQMLFKLSYELKKTGGLQLLDGEIKKLNFNSKIKNLRLPHIGWNNLNFNNSKNPILKNITTEDFFYFIHNYAAYNTSNSVEITKSKYEDLVFPAIVWKKNIFGCQFHPEKSAKSGLKILQNFIDLK
tara:strand:- start:199 stop:864 length:666 start_codon:yes stop_codon:yes gene_type:complete